MTTITHGAPGVPTAAPSLLDTPAPGAGDAAVPGAALPDAALAALPLFSRLLADAAPAADDGARTDDAPAADGHVDLSAAAPDAMAAMLALALPATGAPTAAPAAGPGGGAALVKVGAASGGAYALPAWMPGAAPQAAGAGVPAAAPTNAARPLAGGTAAYGASGAPTAAPSAAPATSVYSAPTAAPAAAVQHAGYAASTDAPTAAPSAAPTSSPGVAPAAQLAIPAALQQAADQLLQGQRRADGQRAELGTISGAALAAGAAPAAASAAPAGDSSAQAGGGNGGGAGGSFGPLNQVSTPAAQPAGGAAVHLAGTPDQWQQPLRDALGDRLQLTLQRNNDHAVIRLEPPNMGSIEISIRHSAGALQVNLSANNSEVLRQLNTIGDSVRQDLSQRNFSDVAVTVSASPRGGSQSLADGGSGRQQGQNQEQRGPGRALGDDEAAAPTFAMTTERE